MIGSTVKEVIEEMNFQEPEFKDGTIESEFGLLYKVETGHVCYLFDYATYICKWSMFVCESQGVAMSMVEDYNKRFVVVNDTIWKFYSNGKVINIYLSFVESAKTYSFMYTTH